jgi:death-on-curing protein
VTLYPTVDDVITVHALLIARFGGSLGVRNRGALESALARPQSGHYDDIIQEAAALWESLSQNHPFVDGNKRVAVTVTAAFLKVNGYVLELTTSTPSHSRLNSMRAGACDSQSWRIGCARTPEDTTLGIDLS